jgi:hypothetical protein
MNIIFIVTTIPKYLYFAIFWNIPLYEDDLEASSSAINK